MPKGYSLGKFGVDDHYFNQNWNDKIISKSSGSHRTWRNLSNAYAHKLHAASELNLVHLYKTVTKSNNKQVVTHHHNILYYWQLNVAIIHPFITFYAWLYDVWLASVVNWTFDLRPALCGKFLSFIHELQALEPKTSIPQVTSKFNLFNCYSFLFKTEISK